MLMGAILLAPTAPRLLFIKSRSTFGSVFPNFLPSLGLGDVVGEEYQFRVNGNRMLGDVVALMGNIWGWRVCVGFAEVVVLSV
jgi:hypothetical protein